MSPEPQMQEWEKQADTVYMQPRVGRQELTDIDAADIPQEEHAGFAAAAVAPLLARVRREGPGRAAHEVCVWVCVCVFVAS